MRSKASTSLEKSVRDWSVKCRAGDGGSPGDANCADTAALSEKTNPRAKAQAYRRIMERRYIRRALFPSYRDIQGLSASSRATSKSKILIIFPKAVPATPSVHPC